MDAAGRRPRRWRSRYVRIVAGREKDPPEGLVGVIRTAGGLVEKGRLDGHARDRLRILFRWLNEALPCPPFSARLKRRAWRPEAVCWFRDDALWMIRRTWAIALILRQHGRPVRVLRSEAPGRILYEDGFQVVAEPAQGVRTS